jgi:hypothetical protein
MSGKVVRVKLGLTIVSSDGRSERMSSKIFVQVMTMKNRCNLGLPREVVSRVEFGGF